MPRIPEHDSLTNYQRGWRCGYADGDQYTKTHRQSNQYSDYYDGYEDGEWARKIELADEAERASALEQDEREQCWFFDEEEYQYFKSHIR